MRTRREPATHEESTPEPAAPVLPPAAAHVLALQRTVGNVAVTRVLARYDELPTKTEAVDVDDDWSDDEEDEEVRSEDEDHWSDDEGVETVAATPRRSEAEQREYDKKLAAEGYSPSETAGTEAPAEDKEAKQERKRAKNEKAERAKQRKEAFERRRETRESRGGMGPVLEAWVDPNETRSEQRLIVEIARLDRRIAEVRDWQRNVPLRLTAQHAKIKAQLDALIDERDARKAERERLRAARDAPPPRPYAFIVKGVEEKYIDEEETTLAFVAGAIQYHLSNDKKRHGVAEMPDRDALKYLYGWTEEDCVKHYDNADKGDKATEAKTEQLRTDEQRAKHALELGGKIEQAGEPFDTSKSTSKADGPGFAIFVMSDTGRFYAGSHKVGLFHHSSLLGGEDAACGGEMKASGGKLEQITNKSGHYLPVPEHLQQALGELARGGVKLAGVTAIVWDTNEAKKVVKRRYDAADFMRRGRQAKVLDEWVEA